MVVVTFQKFDKVLQKYIACQDLQGIIFPRWWSVLSTPVLPWPHCTCHQLDRLQSTCWGQVQDWWQLMPTIHENQQVMKVVHFCRIMTPGDYQQMKKFVVSTSDVSTRLVIRLLPKSSPQTTAVSHRCKMKYVNCIKMIVNKSLYCFCQAWLASWLDLVGELEDFVERFFPRGLLRH